MEGRGNSQPPPIELSNPHPHVNHSNYLKCPLDKNAEDVFVTIKEAGFHLRKAIEDNDATSILRIASEALWELRRPQLTSSYYNDLYTLVINEMSRVLCYFKSQRFPFRDRLLELYEAVQHCGNVLPRLYLMIIVARAMYECNQTDDLLIFQDVSTMATAIQHPLRGLYTRNFLISQLMPCVLAWLETYKTSSLVPPGSTESEPKLNSEPTPSLGDRAILIDYVDEENNDSLGRSRSRSHGVSIDISDTQSCGNVDRCYESKRLEIFHVLMADLKACNKLLTRLGYVEGGGPSGQDIRRQHSFILKAHVEAMSQLTDMDSNFFKETVCSNLLAFMRTLRDPLSQQFLLEAIIKGFARKHISTNIGIILHSIFESSVNDLSSLLEGLSEKFDSENDDHLIDDESLRETATQLKGLEERAAIQLKGYVEDVIAHENPQEIPVPHLAKHWAALFRTFDIVLPMILAKRVEPDQCFYSIKMLYLRFAAPISELNPNISDEKAKLIDAAKASHHSDMQSRSMARIVELSIKDAGFNSDVSDLIHLFFNYGSYQSKLEMARALAAGMAASKFDEVLLPENLQFLLNFVAPYLHETPGILSLAKLNHRIAARIKDTDRAFTLYALMRAACDALPDRDQHGPILAAMINGCGTLLKQSAISVQSRNPIEHSEEDSENNPVPAVVAPAPTLMYSREDILHFVHARCQDLLLIDGELAFYCALKTAMLTDWIKDKVEGQEENVGSELSPMDAATYEFLTTALGIYEERFSNSKNETQFIHKIFHVLQTSIWKLKAGNYEALVARLCNHSCRLLKRGDQTLAILRCAYLFWKEPCKSEDRLLECIQKAVNLAESLTTSKSQQLAILKQILIAMNYFKCCGAEVISDQMVYNLEHACEMASRALVESTARDPKVSEKITDIAAQKYLKQNQYI